MSHRDYAIAVMEGDGIGPEVVEATVRVLGSAAAHHGIRIAFDHLPVGLSAHEQFGSTLPAATLTALETHEASLLGPVTHHLYDTLGTTMPNPSGTLRKRYELFANVRPARSYRNVPNLHDAVDLVIVRENTEGFYADRNVLNGSSEMVITADVTVSLRVITRSASTRVAESAFALARARGRRRNDARIFDRPARVTALHKANVLRRTDGLFLDSVRAVATQYPDVELHDMHADAFALHVLRDPARFDVIVTTNLFGDILSDLTAGMVGGLGLAPGLNVGVDRAMAQATHGSAPDIAGRGIANPVAEILSGAMLLGWLGDRHGDPRLEACQTSIERAIEAALLEPRTRTPDLAGDGTTRTFTDAVIERLATTPGSST
jgi:3-isopropylmalate dehydrogenase